MVGWSREWITRRPESTQQTQFMKNVTFFGLAMNGMQQPAEPHQVGGLNATWRTAAQQDERPCRNVEANGHRLECTYAFPSIPSDDNLKLYSWCARVVNFLPSFSFVFPCPCSIGYGDCGVSRVHGGGNEREK